MNDGDMDLVCMMLVVGVIVFSICYSYTPIV